MSRNQKIFDEWFKDQVYGPRNGFEPRDWQMECSQIHWELLSKHLERFRSNGNADPQHRFTVYAGTGSGKTKASALMASRLLNSKLIDQVAVVTPNRAIKRKTIKDFRENFGIELVNFAKARHSEGIPRTKQGYVLTYALLMNDPTLHRRICTITPTLVIFDEIHHLGDNPELRWGDSALEAYGTVRFVICLTGTPYRSDNTRIPFVDYEPTEDGGLLKFKATPESGTGYTYSLGKAILDGVCRKPQFIFHRGKVQIRVNPNGGYKVVSFDDADLSDCENSARLRGAVTFGSDPRREMLAEALEICRKEHRKVIIFLGGDTAGQHTPTDDAQAYLPQDLESLGITPDEYEVVVSQDVEAQEKIERFGSSDKWILVTINMVSEGVDIPELSAAIFLTSITSKQTTIQRIGRVLRLLSDTDPHKDALIFMFRDPSNIAIGLEIEGEIEIEQRIYQGKPKESTGPGSEQEKKFRVEAIGIEGGEIETIMFHGKEWPIDIFRQAQAELREQGLPATMLDTALNLLMRERNGHGLSA